MLFLYVVFYLLNIMLRKQLGQNLAVLKIIFGIDLLILGGLMLTVTAMLCQYYYYYGRRSGSYSGYPSGLYASGYIDLAFNSFEALSVIGSGILSILAVKSLKQRGIAQNVSSTSYLRSLHLTCKQSLMIWVVVLHFGLLFSAVWSVTLSAMQFGGNYYYTQVTNAVVGWLSSIFHSLSFIAVIMIARNPVWKLTALAEEPQYAYHQEAPVYDGVQRA